MPASTYNGNNAGATANAADLTAAQVQALSGAPQVDLRFPPYNIVANDLTAGTQNSNGIASAIAAFTGTGAALLLPDGKI
jgi:hypothetical protein